MSYKIHPINDAHDVEDNRSSSAAINVDHHHRHHHKHHHKHHHHRHHHKHHHRKHHHHRHHRHHHHQNAVDSSETSSGDVIYDYIVIGSGPGGTGFIYKLLSLHPDATVIWFEEGDLIEGGTGIVRWPDALVPEIRKGNIRAHRFTTRRWLHARAWKAFGGGDAMNSGGPNYIGLNADEDEADEGRANTNIWELRNKNVIDGCISFGDTPLANRFIEAYKNAGYREQTPLPANASIHENGMVGYPSSIFNHSKERHFLAQELYAKFSKDPNLSVRLRTKIVKLLVEGNPSRVCGVVAEYGNPNDRVVYRARKTILAAGLFGTFSLLVDSGIGPPDALNTRGIPTEDRIIENRYIGKEVGDEQMVTCLFIAAEDQGGPAPEGRPPPLVGSRAGGRFKDGATTVIWQRGLMAIISLVTRLCCLFSCLLRPFATGWSYISISLDSRDPDTGKPNMALKATKDSVEIDDSQLKFTSEMMKQYQNQVPALQEFFRLNRAQKQTCSRRCQRCWLRLLTPIINSSVFTSCGLQQGATEFNLNIPQSHKSLGAYQHFYGGCQPHTVLSNDFELYLHPPDPSKTQEENSQRPTLQDLHLSDATVIPKLLPGAPSATVMEWGVRVALKICEHTNVFPVPTPPADANTSAPDHSFTPVEVFTV